MAALNTNHRNRTKSPSRVRWRPELLRRYMTNPRAYPWLELWRSSPRYDRVRSLFTFLTCTSSDDPERKPQKPQKRQRLQRTQLPRVHLSDQSHQQTKRNKARKGHAKTPSRGAPGIEGRLGYGFLSRPLFMPARACASSPT